MPVNIVGVSQATRTPGVYLSILFAAGAISASSAIDRVVVIGHSTSGTAATLYGPDTTTRVSSVSDAISVFGANCELTAFARAYFKVNQQNPLYFVPVADTGVASAVKLTPSGAATVANTINLFINSVMIQVPVASGDSVATQNTNIAAAVNAAKLEFGATVVSGDTVLWAGSPGARNTLSVSVSTAVSDATYALVTGGQWSGSAYVATAPTSVVDIATALTTIGSNNFYHKVLIPGYDEIAANWANSVTKLSAHLTAQALPAVGARTVGYTSCRMKSTASTPSVSDVQTTATNGIKALNNPRLEVVWTSGSNHTPAEILGNFAGAVSLFEQNLDLPYALNMCGFGSTTDTAGYWNVVQPRDAWTETGATLETALETGMTVIGYNSGLSSIIRRSTTKCMDGANADQRIADPHKVLVIDKLSLDIIAVLKQAMKGKVLVDAPLDSNDAIPQNSIAITFIKGAVFKVLDDYVSRSLIEHVATTKASAYFARSKSRSDTIEIQLPIDVIDIAASVKAEIDQTG